MKKSLQISIIVPSYNSQNYIGRCLRSLLNQSFDQDEYEIIVINDGSKDKTKEALKNFLGDIVYLENKINKGLPASLNKAIKNSKGQYIVRVDSDDWVHPQFLNILYYHLNLNPKIDAAACDYHLVDNKQKILSYNNCEKKPIGCGIMFQAINLIDIGLYDKKFFAREEEDLIYRYKKKYTVTRVPIPLYRYRKHDNNMTKNKKLMKKYLKKIKKKYKKS